MNRLVLAIVCALIYLGNPTPSLSPFILADKTPQNEPTDSPEEEKIPTYFA